LFILALLTAITGGALVLLVLRAHVIRSEGRFVPVSREGSLLLNNLLLVGACGVVFIGTLFPLLVDILQLGKISVGPPYFNALFVPLALVLLMVLGVGPLLRWKRDDLKRLARQLGWLAALSLLLGIGLPLLVSGEPHTLVMLSLSLVFWVLLASTYDMWSKVAHKTHRLSALLSLSRSYKGMVMAHVGVALCVTGIAITSVYSVERDLRIQVGKAVTLGPYEFHLLSLRNIQGPNYIATQARVEVLNRKGTVEAILTPEKRLYTVQQMPLTEVAIRPSLTHDLYLALGEPLANGKWAMRIHNKPYVPWISLGDVDMALGGFLAISDPRYRQARRQRWTLRNTGPVAGDANVAQA
jgi:cytochrome c-type biogenesis protein CcmF